MKYTRQKQLIVDAALEQFAEYGFEASNVRDISKRANCSTMVLYKYFKDKKELFMEVYLLCVKIFEDIPKRLGNPNDDPLRRYRNFGYEMLRFSLFEHKNMYLFLFGQGGRHLKLVRDTSEGLFNALINVFNSLQKVLQDCIDAGYKLPTDTFTAAVMSWVFIDGIARLYEGDSVVSRIETIITGKEVDFSNEKMLYKKVEGMVSIFGLSLLNVFNNKETKNKE